MLVCPAPEWLLDRPAAVGYNLPCITADWQPCALLLNDCCRNDQLSKLVSTLRELVSTSALADAESAAYWAYHTGRTGFFLGVVSVHCSGALPAASCWLGAAQPNKDEGQC